MNLRALQAAWNDLATKDAMWAVLTGPRAAKRAWDPEAFFRTGVDEVTFVLERVRANRTTVEPGRALDFGCGVGRLTQALGSRFARADGVDISAVMIERARLANRLGDRCHYHLNETDDLALFADGVFDFVYSNITLQHVEPHYSRRYLQEFFRVTRAGGVVVFQIPSDPYPVVRGTITRSSEPLRREGCRAAIEPPPPLRCAPGAVLPLRIKVRNEGTQRWPCRAEDDGRYSIRLGNHWRGRFGRMKRENDARTALEHDLDPGEGMEIGINPTAPTKPGKYILEFDMVQEHVRWFAELGSPPARTRVVVDAALRPGEVEGLPGLIEMFGIPRPEVEALIRRCGAELVAVDEDDAPGPGWTSYRYIARRGP
jgi:SAM-dependent methyltransferase